MNNFTILKYIGSGTYGKVYKAKNKETNKIKFIFQLSFVVLDNFLLIFLLFEGIR